MTDFPSHREKLGQWLNERGLVGAMAEIGVAHGGFAKMVLRDWKGSKYHMVDPWIAQAPTVYKERQEEPWKYERWFEECSAIAATDARIVVTRKFAHDAVTDFKDGSLDCCYLDGNHSLECVNQDLKDWWPKVKSGGLFCGHDFYDCVTDGYWNEVKTAVLRWCHEAGLNIAISECSSWWLIKP